MKPYNAEELRELSNGCSRQIQERLRATAELLEKLQQEVQEQGRIISERTMDEIDLRGKLERLPQPMTYEEAWDYVCKKHPIRHDANSYIQCLRDLGLIKEESKRVPGDEHTVFL